MKKSLLLSAAVAATMLYSCSSDETVSVPSIDKSDLTPVVLSLAKNSTEVYQTRGTGTVGDTAKTNNVFNKEDLFVLMTTVPSEATEWKFTTVDAKDNPTEGLGEQFNNTFKARPNAKADSVGIEYFKYAGMYRYYPINGIRSDFFVYHIDDAAENAKNTATFVGPDGSINEGLPIVKDGENPETKIVEFKIDGSQDILAGKAHKVLTDAQIVTLGAEEATTRGFNAKTARAGVVPQIALKHLLTRFTFSIQAGDTCAQGLIIDSIKVVSKSTGKLLVAYNENKIREASELIEWSDATDSLSLKERRGEIVVGDDKTKLDSLSSYTVNIAGLGTPSPILDPENIGEALFVKPNETEYSLAIYYRFPYGGKEFAVTDDKQKIRQANNVKFEPGKSYHVNIKVYGMNEISLVTTLESWEDGGTIDIDTDDIYQQ